MIPTKHRVHLPNGTGKACRGCAKTISLQVVRDMPDGSGFIIRKLFRFTNGDEDSMRKAYAKAFAHARQLDDLEKERGF